MAPNLVHPDTDSPDLSPKIIEYNEGYQLVTVSSVTIFLVPVVLGLRIWSRRAKGVRLGLDDWLIIASAPFVIVCDVSAIIRGRLLSTIVFSEADAEIVVKYGGVGRRMAAVMAEDSRIHTRSLIILFINEYNYAILLTLVKLSVLSLYHRVFPTQFMKRACYLLGSSCLVWWIACVFILSFQCRPIYKFWEPFMKSGHCLDEGPVFMIGAVPNILLDLCILTLPIIEVRKLQMRRSLKIFILGIFLLGGVVIIASCIRVKTIMNFFQQGEDGDFTQLMNPFCIWTVIETFTAILCACLPTMQPVLNRLFARLHIFNLATDTAQSANSEIVTIGGSGSTPRRKTFFPINDIDASLGRTLNDDSAEHIMMRTAPSRDGNGTSENVSVVSVREK